MKNHAIETSGGIFVFIGLICVGYLTIQLGKMELLGDRHYYLTARFGSVSGLKEGAIVDVAGVQIGKVENIALNETMEAVVVMKIKKEIKLDEESIASVKTSGLIGDKYIKIEPGGSDAILENGDEIIETESAVDLEKLISEFAFGKV